MRIHIRRISPPSLSLVLGLFFGLVTFVVSIISLFQLPMKKPEGDGFFLVVMLLVVGPILYALMGIISGFVLAWIYNFVARYTKGVLIEYSEATRYDD